MSKVYFRKRKKKLSFKIMIFAGLFFCVLAGLAYFFIWSPILQIENIEVESDKSPVYYTSFKVIALAKEELNKKIFRFIPQNTVILAPINKIKSAILDRFPEIRQINVYRSSVGLNISIEERESIGIWCKIIETSQERKVGQCFQIDKDGVIYRESLLIKGSSVLNIYSARNQSAGIRDVVVSLEVIDFILAVKEGTDILISDFEPVAIEDLRGITSWGWQVYFNPVYSVDAQLKTLEIVLKEEIQENYASLEYIDLRIQGRVYYK